MLFQAFDSFSSGSLRPLDLTLMGGLPYASINPVMGLPSLTSQKLHKLPIRTASIDLP